MVMDDPNCKKVDSIFKEKELISLMAITVMKQPKFSKIAKYKAANIYHASVNACDLVWSYSTRLYTACQF